MTSTASGCMAYLDADVVEAVTGESGWWFADAVRHAPASARRVTALLDAMWQADEPLAFDGALLDLVTKIRRHARIATQVREGNASRFADVVDYLHVRLLRGR